MLRSVSSATAITILALSFLQAEDYVCTKDPIYQEYVQLKRVSLDGAAMYADKEVCESNCRDYSDCVNTQINDNMHYIGLNCSDDNFYFKYTQISPVYLHIGETFSAIAEGLDTCQGDIEPSVENNPSWLTRSSAKQITLEKYEFTAICQEAGDWNSSICLSAVGDNITSTKCQNVNIVCCENSTPTIQWETSPPTEATQNVNFYAKAVATDDECDTALNNDIFYLENNPTWMSIASSGAITGITETGNYNITVCVKDAQNNSNCLTFALSVE